MRFEEDDVRSMGRNATGVRGMNLAEKDYIVGMATTPKPGAAPVADRKGEKKESDEDLVPEKGSLILSVTENGYGKRTPADEYRLTNRGGKGVITMNVTEKTGKVVAVRQVGTDEQVMLITDGGKVIRLNVKDVRITGRNAQGVHLVRLDQNEHVRALAGLAEKEDDESNGNGADSEEE